MTHEPDDRSFDHALEAALHGRTAFSDTLSDEDQAVLALASDLAAADFSAAYGERAALRRRLLDQHGDSRREWSLTGGRLTMLAHKRRLAMIAAALVLVGGLAFARFSPAMAASREQVAAMVAASSLPDGVQQVAFNLIGAHFGAVIGNPDGTVREIRFNDVGSFEEAQAAAGFILKQPTALPEGYALKAAGVSEEGDWVNLLYENGAGDPILFSQTTVAPPEGASQGSSSARSVVAHGATGGEEPSWQMGEGDPASGAIPLNIIQWEEGGVYYDLSGTFSEAELQAIADSVQ